jgi:uncharacterized protein YcbX
MDENSVVNISLPDGRVVKSSDPDVNDVLSSYLGASVTLTDRAPSDYSVQYIVPNLGTCDDQDPPARLAERHLGPGYFRRAGLPSPLREGAFHDLYPLSLITTASLRRLSELAPYSDFSERRFRMNIVVDTSAHGFVEENWLGALVRIGDEAAIEIVSRAPRCIVPTLQHGDLPRDLSILRTIGTHNRRPIVGGKVLPCVGVYTVVHHSGTVREGDLVQLAIS